MFRRVPLLIAAAACALATPAAAAARPDLAVRSGSVSIAGDQLTGQITIVNRGADAGSSSVVLRVTVAGMARQLGRQRVAAIGAGKTRQVSWKLTVSSALRAHTRPIRACADAAAAIRERDERNCRVVGSLPRFASSTPTPTPPAPVVSPSTPTPPSTAPASSVPSAPIPFTVDAPFVVAGSWAEIPSSYDRSHQTATPLLVWLHGCGGYSKYDIADVAAAPTGGYLTIAVGGRENGCWDVNADDALVLAAIAEMRAHFNVAPSRIVLAGYSSGGDLAYRTAFTYPGLAKRLLIENSSPFRDTGLSAGSALAAVGATRFPILHLAHTGDGTYPIDGVRGEVGQLQTAGFDVTLLERPGGHYDGATVSDLKTLLLPHVTDA